MAFPLALRDFSKQIWPGTPLNIVAKLLRGPLEGLASLHNAGYMHRDVSPKNILVMSKVPAQAALCDYGKAVKAETATLKTIGPTPFLAPEVGKVEGYTNKIDIWGFGLVCCYILFPKVINTRINESKRPDQQWFATITRLLSEFKKKGKQQESFAHFIERMFRWLPEERYTVSASLI